MTRRRELLVAILVYVTLDLALPAMPGAFVFEPADSVESVGGGRATVRSLVVPGALAGPVAVAPLLASDVRHRWPRRGEAAVLDAPSMHPLARGCCGLTSPPEDPH
jgi:hypothetical protein